MPALETHFNSLNFCTQLVEIKNLIESAHAKITFWGGRVIEVNGFTGSVSLDSIAEKILKAGHQRCQADNLTTPERIAGIDIVKKLNTFYQGTDNQVKNANLITKIINWIREFRFVPYYTTRFNFDENAKNYFRAYSEIKFLQEFGGAIGFNHFHERSHPAADNWFMGPAHQPMPLARENLIRSLL